MDKMDKAEILREKIESRYIREIFDQEVAKGLDPKAVFLALQNIPIDYDYDAENLAEIINTC